MSLEEIRRKLRGIMKFLEGDGKRSYIYTTLADPASEESYGASVMPGEDFADYKLKVNRYLSDFADKPAIRKLHANEPLSQEDFEELERIFTEELGTAQDYGRAYGDTPFGLLVRQVVKLDREAAMKAFAEFINDEGLSDQQRAFVHRIVDHIVASGYMEPEALAQAPFDRPQSFVRLFDRERQIRLVGIIRDITNKALAPAA